VQVAKTVFFSFAFLILDLTVMPKVAVWGAFPNVIVGMTVYVGFAAGGTRGSIYGFIMGLAMDLAAPGTVGVGALAGATVGYVVGLSRQSFYREGLWTQAAVIAVSVVLWNLFHAVFAGGGSFARLLGAVFTRGLLQAAYTALLCPLLLVVVRRTVWTDIKLDA